MARAREIVEHWLDAFARYDVERILAPLHDQVVVSFESAPRPLVGKQALRRMLPEVPGELGRIRMERQVVVESGPDVAVLLRAQVEFRADLELAGEKLALGGKRLDVLAALFLTVDDAGQITKVTRVRDNWSVFRQLGVSPEQVDRIQAKLSRSEPGLG